MMMIKNPILCLGCPNFTTIGCCATACPRDNLISITVTTSTSTAQPAKSCEYIYEHSQCHDMFGKPLNAPMLTQREEITRCRDCEHIEEDDLGCLDGAFYCDRCGYVKPDGFCKWGKRRQKVDQKQNNIAKDMTMSDRCERLEQLVKEMYAYTDSVFKIRSMKHIEDEMRNLGLIIEETW